MKIRTKFNLMLIAVIFFLNLSVGLVTKLYIDKSLTDLYEDRVKIESNLTLNWLDEHFPGDWNVKNNELYKGNVKINDNNEILENIGEVTDGIANIFLKNSTVATNIVVDGERRIGAEADSQIAETVLEKGEIYTGQADISGELYLTMYQPIKDSDGKIIGMWLVGSPISMIDKTIFSLLITILITMAVTGIIIVIFSVFFTRTITRPINVVNEQLKEIAEGEGDLTKEILVNSKDEVGDMAASFNKMLGSLRTMLGQVSDTSEQVASSSEQLLESTEQTYSATNHVVSSIQEVASTIEVQGKNTEESAQSIAEITNGIQQVTGSINIVAEAANETMIQANKGNTYIQKVVGQVENIYQTSTDTIQVMKKLENRSIEIGKIIDVITDIASQTNLLALNAAIEAARAGEHGKGFSVVADEVRKLAEQSSQSANQIIDLIKLIQNDTTTAVKMSNEGNIVAKEGLKLAEETGNSFDEILKSIESVSSQMQELSAVSEEITASIEQVNSSIEEIAQMAKKSSNHSYEITSATEKQLSTMDEVAASIKTLTNMAEQLRELVNRFKI